MKIMAKKQANKLTEQLRAAVKNCGMTLGELTKATDIDKAALSRFLNGHRGVSMEAMDALGELLGLRIVANKTKPTKGK
jgi:transcriptional regulator with XRE-family HTH domain